MHDLPYIATRAKTRGINKRKNFDALQRTSAISNVPFGVTYVKIGTIQRRLAWPLHKDDTLFRSGRPTGLNIYLFILFPWFCFDLIISN
ncbi:hypothetical protein BKA82DRAFT_948001 [Pisolithus tinctorius]|uniref:Uncharacterized protein n=1 Tax=Pisolithus tinctorius Marx 270 TaxID=870435 RepID=A0A0C3NXN9_PISTI|nr:hypothetical protein BKA82DRAFT_948001 [Pisolithus tinctorius]KIO05600.1 hypothetical protein M404DRAFT_948001 [Pisolithus tinctorius Marx 270]